MLLPRIRSQASAAVFLIAFAVTVSLAGFDWFMALEPGWASTMFGVYIFSGLFLGTLSALAVGTGLLARNGGAGLTAAQSHDLGKLIFGFSMFWAYIWYCQYMLIWYTNFNEETGYMLLRSSSGWGKLFVLNVLLNWAVPFLVLLPRANKMNPRTLAVGAVILLAGRVCDLYVMIVAPFSPASPVPAIWDLAALALAAACFVLLTLRAFFQAEPVPIGDPLLPESVHSHA